MRLDIKCMLANLETIETIIHNAISIEHGIVGYDFNEGYIDTIIFFS